MRSTLACTAIVVISTWLFSATAHGQATPDSVAMIANIIPHKFNLGLRYSTFSETEISLSGRYFLRPQSALHLTAGREIGGGGSQSIAVFYERHRPLFRSKHLRYLYGAGFSISFPKIRGERKWSDASPYAGVTLGAEYVFNAFPLAIGLDFRQLFRLEQASSTESHNLAVSAHYIF